jgi:hypothetical protein
MQVLSAVSSGGSAVARRQGQRQGLHMLRRLLGSGSDFFLHDADSSQRNELESYITRCFEQAYNARINDFAPLLLELRCAGSASGAAGIRFASKAPLFLEHYLDVPVEQVASQVAGQPILRNEIVEMCNLAALRPGACQLINIVLAAALHAAGFCYAGFAGTAQLERIVRKQHFAVTAIAVADPARLGADADQWGSYYDTSPNVLLVDLQQTMEALRTQYLPTAVCAIFAETIDGLSTRLAEFNRLTATPDATVV